VGDAGGSGAKIAGSWFFRWFFRSEFFSCLEHDRDTIHLERFHHINHAAFLWWRIFKPWQGLSGLIPTVIGR